jgi:hypothetical protein
MFLTPVSYQEVFNCIMNLSNSRSIGADCIAPEIIKANAALLCDKLVHIFNLSFVQGIFPQLLKRAIVVPIYKSGLRTDPSNYRPISVLTVFSKLLEKLFYNHLISLSMSITYCTVTNLVLERINLLLLLLPMSFLV